MLGKGPRPASLLAADQARAALAQSGRAQEPHAAEKPEGLRERMEAKLTAQRASLGTHGEHPAGPS